MQPQNMSPKRDRKIAKHENIHNTHHQSIQSVYESQWEPIGDRRELFTKGVIAFVIILFYLIMCIQHVSTICLHLVLNRVW